MKAERPFLLSVLFGTRPEAIKLAPLIHELKKQKDIQLKIIFTGQHEEMVAPILSYFNIIPDYNLKIMKSNQPLSQSLANILENLPMAIGSQSPDGMIVQGDTLSCFAGGLWAYLNRIPLFHVEAGLRSFNLEQPWPEEYLRRVTAIASTLHFAPTEESRINLINEGIESSRVHVVGNTVIDALMSVISRIKKNELVPKYEIKRKLLNWKSQGNKIVLATVHRRENLGDPLKEIFLSLKEIASWPNVKVILPLHLNPQVRSVAQQILGYSQVNCIEPLDYLSFIHLMSETDLILSDSGGIQEEAPSLGKPVLVLRETTERPEALNSGACYLVGTNRENIILKSRDFLKNESLDLKIVNPFGNGDSSQRIVPLLLKFLKSKRQLSLNINSEWEKMSQNPPLSDFIIGL